MLNTIILISLSLLSDSTPLFLFLFLERELGLTSIGTSNPQESLVNRFDPELVSGLFGGSRWIQADGVCTDQLQYIHQSSLSVFRMDTFFCDFPEVVPACWLVATHLTRFRLNEYMLGVTARHYTLEYIVSIILLDSSNGKSEQYQACKQDPIHPPSPSSGIYIVILSRTRSGLSMSM